MLFKKLFCDRNVCVVPAFIILFAATKDDYSLLLGIKCEQNTDWCSPVDGNVNAQKFGNKLG